MSLAILKSFFQPRSVAVIGASRHVDSLGCAVLRNLLRAELEGPVLPVNPKHESVLGVRCHRSVADLPVVPELAVLCTPEQTLPGLLEMVGRRGTRAAIVMSRVRDVPGGAGVRDAMLAAARAHGVRFLGPGSDGVQVPAAHLDASWTVTRARPGNVSLISQSGSLIAGMLPWAESRGIGFSHVISYGEALDVRMGDLLDYLATEARTHAVLLYLKTLHDSRKFLSAARALARIEPVIAIKPGGANGETGIVFPGGQVLPGVDPDAVHDVAMQRAGMLRVRDVDELFDAAETLTHGKRPSGDNLAIVCNGAGPAEMALGALLEGGGKVPPLAPATREALAALSAPARLDAFVDLGRDATARRYGRAVSLLLADPSVHGVLVMHAPTPLAPDESCAEEVVAAMQGSERFVLACWLGAAPGCGAERRLAGAGIPNYPSPEKATRVFLHLVRYRRNQYLLRQTPATPMPDPATAQLRQRARSIVESALAEGRRWLHEEETYRLLECYGIAAPPTRLAASPDDAVSVALELGLPVTMRASMRPPGAPHELRSEAAVREHAEALFAHPGAAVPGMPEPRAVVQAVRRRPDALILMAGIATDPLFGRILHLGPGGLQKSSSEGAALALPPLNMALADEMLSRTRVDDMVAQTFNRSGLDRRTLQSLLVRLSGICVDLPEVTVLQINPLLADRDGVLAQEARLAIEPPQAGRSPLAIRPYPGDLEEEVTLKDGTSVLLRPVRPEDDAAYARLLSRLSPEDLYDRFFRAGPVPREVALELIHIDYDRQMTFLATRPGPGGETEILGAVDSMTTADNQEAEYAMFVRSDLKRKGLGRALLEKMIRYCRERGTGVLYGIVLKSNVAMLSLDFKLGFQPHLRAAGEGPESAEKMVLTL